MRSPPTGSPVRVDMLGGCRSGGMGRAGCGVDRLGAGAELRRVLGRDVARAACGLPAVAATRPSTGLRRGGGRTCRAWRCSGSGTACCRGRRAFTAAGGVAAARASVAVAHADAGPAAVRRSAAASTEVVALHVALHDLDDLDASKCAASHPGRDLTVPCAPALVYPMHAHGFAAPPPGGGQRGSRGRSGCGGCGTTRWSLSDPAAQRGLRRVRLGVRARPPGGGRRDGRRWWSAPPPRVRSRHHGEQLLERGDRLALPQPRRRSSPMPPGMPRSAPTKAGRACARGGAAAQLVRGGAEG